MANMTYVAGLEAFAKAAAEALAFDAFQEVLELARLSLSLGEHSHEWANLESALSMLNGRRALLERSLCRTGPVHGDEAAFASH